MTLNLPLLYFVWTEEYCQTSPNKNKATKSWHLTSILVCCIFVLDHYSRSSFLLRLKSHDWFKPMQPSGTKSTPNTMQLRKLFATDSFSSNLGHLVSLIMRYNRIRKIIMIYLQLMSQLFRAELSLDQILVEYPNFCPKMVQPKETKWPWLYAIQANIG